MSTLQVTFDSLENRLPFGSTLSNWGTEETVAALANGRLISLHQPLTADSSVVAVTLKTRIGHRIYRRTLAFLLEQARRQVNLPPFVLGPSWGGAHAYDTPERQPLPEESLKALREALASLVASDLPLEPVQLPFSAAWNALGHPDDAEARLLLSQRNPAEVTLMRCGSIVAWEPEVLLPSTGRASVWALEATETGLVLRFPTKAWPLVLAPWTPSPALAQAHTEAWTWNRLQKVSTVARLNALADNGSVEAFIQGAEAVHERKIALLADAIVQRGCRIVLIAGPSSSGKTTSAKRLAVQLQACGRQPLVVSLDDYFLNREDTPKDAEGRYDFESLDALDKNRLAEDLEVLLADRTVELPVFDFKTGRRRSEGRPYRLGSDGVLVLEGIHGLNHALWPGRPGLSFRIYVSALSSLTREGRTRIGTSDHRLIRRLVRDRQFRGYSALQTLRQWASVRRGEDAHLFPFQDEADGVFNSALPYEFAVLREAALPLLETVPPSEPEYPQAQFLKSFLEGFIPIPIRFVPPFSLLREFLGQSGFRY